MPCWQVQLSGAWQDMAAEDNAAIEAQVTRGKSQFQIRSRNQDYTIELAADGISGKQINVSSGRSRSLRLWPPPGGTDAQMTNEVSMTNAFTVSKAGSVGGALGPESPGSPPGVSRFVSRIDYSKMRIYVWLSGDWHPISAVQDQQIKAALGRGETIFEVTEGSFRFTIDTTGKSGWIQKGKNKTRKMKVVTDAGDDAAAAAEVQSSRGVYALFREEWKAVSGGRPKMSRQQLISSWMDACKEVEDRKLLEQTAADIFNRIDLGRNGYIEEHEWVHYKLLELQAPSFHSLAQVNEKVLEWEKEKREVLSELLQIFVKHGGGDADARISASEMKRVAAEWAKRYPVSTKPQLKKSGVVSQEKVSVTSARYLADLLADRIVLEEDAPVTYYDFMNHMLGRSKAVVQLYKYDLTNGKAWWLSPVLLGQHFEGIWHTGIVVHSKEYWFGGNIFESQPGTTPFGTPTAIVDLPEHTMRTREDLWNFISRELASEFTKANYDVLTHNCNHFSDAVSLFLLSEHIPDDVLKQPEMILNTFTAQALRPVLNRWLGNFGDDAADASGGRKTDEVATKDEWAQMLPNTLVVYEFKPGWSCIARLVEKEGETCAVRWLNPSTRSLLREDGVSRTLVTALPTTKPKAASKGGGHGVFSACIPVVD
eukprot:CAMPEP_0178395882 /NCGR_PEP_ID=MMETSP0689_2-20121128/13445_1 /TAXON_ID=160604 /ORGANISM="Amphidinium massartii, Strain CS-259" /LENGTH=652 /DNA_ID=CAMNT_0020016545 /DNA_START=1 /DNA_END=1959 /DNA_ORIENTATION=-